MIALFYGTGKNYYRNICLYLSVLFVVYKYDTSSIINSQFAVVVIEKKIEKKINFFSFHCCCYFPCSFFILLFVSVFFFFCCCCFCCFYYNFFLFLGDFNQVASRQAELEYEWLNEYERNDLLTDYLTCWQTWLAGWFACLFVCLLDIGMNVVQKSNKTKNYNYEPHSSGSISVSFIVSFFNFFFLAWNCEINLIKYKDIELHCMFVRVRSSRNKFYDQYCQVWSRKLLTISIDFLLKWVKHYEYGNDDIKWSAFKSLNET